MLWGYFWYIAMRRRAGGNKTYLLKIRQLKHFFSKTQMSVMNRVESPTQNADRFFTH